MKKYKEDSMSKLFFFLINLKSVFEERRKSSISARRKEIILG